MTLNFAVVTYNYYLVKYIMQYLQGSVYVNMISSSLSDTFAALFSV